MVKNIKFFEKFLFLPKRFLVFISKKGYIKKSKIIKNISVSAFIVSPMQTLKEIEHYITENKKGIYLRFGDGDVFLANMKKDMYQIANKKLAAEMKEAIALKGNNILKCLMIHSTTYGREKEMYTGNHLVSDNMANNLLLSAFPFFVGYKIYSPIALHYAATYYPDNANSFLKLLKAKTVLFIGNKDIPLNIVNLLFGKVPHIKTPIRNSYEEIDRIEEETVIELNKLFGFGVVVVAMGCSGRPLMKRIYKRGYNVFLFDYGSLLDGICGNNTRTWMKKEPINYNILLGNL